MPLTILDPEGARLALLAFIVGCTMVLNAILGLWYLHEKSRASGQ